MKAIGFKSSGNDEQSNENLIIDMTSLIITHTITVLSKRIFRYFVRIYSSQNLHFSVSTLPVIRQ